MSLEKLDTGVNLLNYMSNQITISKVSVNMNIAIPKKMQEKVGGLEKGQYILFFEEKG